MPDRIAADLVVKVRIANLVVRGLVQDADSAPLITDQFAVRAQDGADVVAPG